MSSPAFANRRIVVHLRLIVRSGRPLLTLNAQDLSPTVRAGHLATIFGGIFRLSRTTFVSMRIHRKALMAVDVGSPPVERGFCGAQ